MVFVLSMTCYKRNFNLWFFMDINSSGGWNSKNNMICWSWYVFFIVLKRQLWILFCLIPRESARGLYVWAALFCRHSNQPPPWVGSLTLVGVLNFVISPAFSRPRVVMSKELCPIKDDSQTHNFGLNFKFYSIWHNSFFHRSKLSNFVVTQIWYCFLGTKIMDHAF